MNQEKSKVLSESAGGEEEGGGCSLMAQIWLTNTHPVTRASTGGKLLFCRAAVVSRFLGLSWVALPPRPRRSTRPSPLKSTARQCARTDCSRAGPARAPCRNRWFVNFSAVILPRAGSSSGAFHIPALAGGRRADGPSLGGRQGECVCGQILWICLQCPPPNPTTPCNPKGSLNLKLPFPTKSWRAAAENKKDGLKKIKAKQPL